MYWKLHTTAKCITWCATKVGGTARKTGAQCCMSIHITPSTHTIFHGLPNKSWLLLDVIFSFHCLGYSWRHSILTSRRYKTLTIRLKKTVSWRAKTLTMSAPDFVPALVEPEHFSHLGTVWKFVVDQYTIGVEVQPKHSNCWNWYLHPWLQG